MSRLKKLVSVTTLCLIIAWLRNAHALATGSTVFDPMNFMRNTTTALNSIRQVEAEAEMVLTLERGLMLRLAQWRSYPGRMLTDLAGLRALRDQIAAYQQFIAALEQTQGSVQQAYRRLVSINRRLASARLSWQGYERLLTKGLRRRQAAAERSVLYDRRILAAVGQDYRRLRLLEARLAVPGSMKEELELLNGHLQILASTQATELTLLAHHAERRGRARSRRSAMDRALLARYHSLEKRDQALLDILLEQTDHASLSKIFTLRGSNRENGS